MTQRVRLCATRSHTAYVHVHADCDSHKPAGQCSMYNVTHLCDYCDSYEVTVQATQYVMHLHVDLCDLHEVTVQENAACDIHVNYLCD